MDSLVQLLSATLRLLRAAAATTDTTYIFLFFDTVFLFPKQEFVACCLPNFATDLCPARCCFATAAARALAS